MYKDGKKCPICSNGELSEKVITEKFEYKGEEFLIPDYHIFECNNCAEELVAPKTIKATEKILTDFRRRIDGLLTSEEIKSIRKRMGKTQMEMAALIGVGMKNFARYENGLVTQSKAMDQLLRILAFDPYIIQKAIKKTPSMSYNLIGKPITSCHKEADDIEYRQNTPEPIKLESQDAAA